MYFFLYTTLMRDNCGVTVFKCVKYVQVQM